MTSVTTSKGHVNQLWRISAGMDSLMATLEQADGEFDSPEAVAAFDAFMTQSGLSMADTLDAIDERFRQLKLLSAGWQADAKLMMDRVDACDRELTAFKSSVFRFMKLHGHDRLTSTKGVAFKIVNNGGVLPLNCGLDPTTAEDRFVTVTLKKSINNVAVRDALMAGEVVPGASLGERGQRLEVK